MIEICCGSYEDALAAYQGGAKQVELNSALALGGLTPSLASLLLTKQKTDLKVICMVRPRAGGFCYSPNDFEVMKADCRLLLDNGADGIAFGCLTEDFIIDIQRTQEMVELIHSYHKVAVFHRAIDVVDDYEYAIDQLIQLKVDRILTSGQKEKAIEAVDLLKQVQEKYGHQIEFLIGSGINASNAQQIVTTIGISNLHSSCKDWMIDPTTQRNGVSYS